MDLINIGLGAIVALVAVTVAIAAAEASRRGANGAGESTGESTSDARVHSVDGTMDRVRTGRVHGLCGVGPGPESVDHVDGASVAHSATAPPAPEPPRQIHMGAADQVEAFLEFMLDDLAPGERLEFSHRRLVQQYAGWARVTSVVPLPELTVLTLLAKDRRVEKRRGARLKDKAGNVVRTPEGTPIRPITYTLMRPRAVVLPGKAPVGPLVPAWELPPARRAA